MRKFTYQEVKEYIESFEYELLSNEYINGSTKLKVRCFNGHEYEVAFNKFKQGKRCPYCYGNVKLTYEFVKKYIESFGYKLLSTEYINALTKLRVKCPQGHEYEVVFNNFKKGQRCSRCQGIIRYNYQEVKDYIKSFNYELLSNENEYKNSKTKLLIKCPLGHEYETTFDHFKRGNRCPYCYGNVKYTIEEVKEYIESFRYKLLSEEYINAHEKLEIKCSKGHKYNASFSDFKQGRRCPYCSENIKYTYDEVKNYIESFNYKLLSTEYINANKHLLVQCPNGHKPYQVTFSAFKNGEHRCSECYGNSKLTYEYVKEYIEFFEYELLREEYKNAQTKLKIQCPLGHQYNVSFDSFKRGNRCPYCKISKGEKRIIDWLEKNNIKYIYDKPYFDDLLSPLGNPLRPDFIIENKKIWIEYDGEFHYKKYYEEQNFEKIQINDKLKDEYAKKHGWKMIRIPYWEFDNIEEILDKEFKINN